MALERQTVKELHEVRSDHLARYLRAAECLKNDWTVLDLACGCGYGSFILANHAQKIVAVDRSAEAIAWAKTYFHKPNIQWVESDWHDFAYGEAFDAVVCLETVEHINDDRGLLRKLHAYLKPGGLLIISTPNERLMPYNEQETTFHVKHYTPNEIQTILYDCGFSVADITFQEDEHTFEFSPYEGRFLFIKARKMAGTNEETIIAGARLPGRILFVANWGWNAGWQKRAGMIFSAGGIEPHFVMDEINEWADLHRIFGPNVHYIDARGSGRIEGQNNVYYYRKIQSLVRTLQPSVLVLWNGYGYLLTDTIRQIGEAENIKRVFLELGFFRKGPSSLIVDPDGVNARSQKLKQFSFAYPNMDTDTQKIIAGWKTRVLEKRVTCTLPRDPFVFFPLQVHDDTQIYFHSPYFQTVAQALAQVVAAMPADVSLVVKPHPVDIARYGHDAYRACLRPQDILVAASENIYQLIRAARGMITINSTAGFEALVFHKPVLVLGEAFYAGKGLTIDYQGENLAEKIKDMLVFTPPIENIDRLIHYLLNEYLFVYHGDVLTGEICETDIYRLANRIACEAGLSLSLNSGVGPVGFESKLKFNDRKGAAEDTGKIMEQYRLASELAQKGNFDEALDLFALILETAVEPSLRRQIYGGAYFHQGDILLNKGEKTRAVEMFKKTLRYIPDHRLAKQKLLEIIV
ncbi:MAG TPA: methyltransferase domain-containing protein [Candidatus Deferrimicrobium sp.]|nr:methyltransferase domain-containing protein [Candidatus Deferrimicrobium sp.]